MSSDGEPKRFSLRIEGSTGPPRSYVDDYMSAEEIEKDLCTISSRGFEFDGQVTATKLLARFIHGWCKDGKLPPIPASKREGSTCSLTVTVGRLVSLIPAFECADNLAIPRFRARFEVEPAERRITGSNGCLRVVCRRTHLSCRIWLPVLHPLPKLHPLLR